MELNNKAYQVIIASEIIGDQVFVDDIKDCRQDVDKSILNK